MHSNINGIGCEGIGGGGDGGNGGGCINTLIFEINVFKNNF
jgi:hypothetical protein